MANPFRLFLHAGACWLLWALRTAMPKRSAWRVARFDTSRDGLDEWRPDALADILMAAAVADGRAVSVCASVRSSASIPCAGVETLAVFRGRGFAAAAVAAWNRAVRARSATPFYATTFDNTPSQRPAFRLGLRPVASEFSVGCDNDGRRATSGSTALDTSPPSPVARGISNVRSPC